MRIETSKELSVYIEKLVHKQGMSYIDAILYYCEENNLDEEKITNRIDYVLKEKIRKEAQDLNYFKKTPSLLQC